jgi:hypothetical protein
MSRISATLLAAALGALLLVPARADIGPRPPITTREVSDPQNHLAMRDETVNVTIDGHKAQVKAFFHFASVQDVWRQSLAMRLGFPELLADRPLTRFVVKQRVYNRGGHPTGWDAVTDIRPQGAGPGSPLKARWKTWPLFFQGHNGAPSREDVDTEVSYQQELTPVNGRWRYTYVLRSGAPWSGPIGRASVHVVVKNARVVASAPPGAKASAGTLTWTFENLEPAQDIVVTVK